MKHHADLTRVVENFEVSQDSEDFTKSAIIEACDDRGSGDDQLLGIVIDPSLPPELEPHPLVSLAPWELATYNSAQRFAEKGFPVFPAMIGSEGEKKSHKSAKHSGGKRWGATTDYNEIMHDWAAWPDAMIGIVTGTIASGGSGLIVLDIDTDSGHGVDGVKNFHDFLMRHGKSVEDLPVTAEAMTPTGGRHLYYKLREDLGPVSFTRQLAPGFDIQADKQTIIAPPSYRRDKGANYSWVRSPDDTQIVEVPDWLLQLVIKPEAAGVTEARHGGVTCEVDTGDRRVDLSGDTEMVLDQVISILRRAEVGERNGTLNKCAYTLGGIVAAGRIDERIVHNMLLEAALEIGLGAGESMRTIESGLSAGKLKPIPGKCSAAILSVRNTDLSHDALAGELDCRGFDENARYAPKRDSWYFWDETRWLLDDSKRHMTLVRKYLRMRADELISSALQEAQNLKAGEGQSLITWARKEARQLKDRHTIIAVERLAQSNENRTVDLERLDADLFLLGTPNGTVDLRTGHLRPADRQDLITKQTACGPAEKGDLPALWLNFLNRIFDGDQEVIDFMQRLTGYCLTGDIREHKMFFFHGSGRNGKSVFHKTLNRICADYCCDAPAELFMASNFPQHPTGLAGLRGARLVIGSEIPRSAMWNEAQIKKLTGGDRVSARFMRGDYFTYDPQLKLIIAGNEKPRLAGVDPAMRARMVLIPFTVQIPKEEQNPNLEDELFAEGPQILRWAIEGAVSWNKMGLAVPASIVEASNQYLDDEDIVKTFLDEQTTADPKLKSEVREVYSRFRAWCGEEGLHVISRRAFVSEMARHGYVQIRQSACYFFMSIGLH